MHTFIAALTSEMASPDIPEIDESAVRRVSEYDWPGNVLELCNVIERSLILSKENRLSLIPPWCASYLFNAR